MYIYIYMTRVLSNLLRIFAWDEPPSVGAMIRNMRSSEDFAMKHIGEKGDLTPKDHDFPIYETLI